MINRKMHTIDNKGFTLLEVLVAMIILSIISVPLIRAFATSAFTNQKAKTEMICTTAAENVIEDFRNYSLDDIIDKYNAAEVSDLTDSTPSGQVNKYMVTPSGKYVFDIFSNDDMRSELPDGYFARVELDPDKYANTNDFNPINLTSVSANNSAIYTMETNFAYNDEGIVTYPYSRLDEEEYALWEHESNNYIDSLTISDNEKTDLKNIYNAAYFRKNLAREITYTIDYDSTVEVSVDNASTGSGSTESGAETKPVDLCKIDLVIKYSLKNTLLVDGKNPLKPDNNANDLFSYKSGNGDDAGFAHVTVGTVDNRDDEKKLYILFDNRQNQTELDSIYLFFYPRYLAADIDGNRDKINIVNLNNVKANVYLVSMDNQLPEEAAHKGGYLNGAGKLVVNFNGPAADYTNMTLRTNMTKNGAPYSKNDPQGKGEIQFRLSYSKNGSLVEQSKLYDFLRVSNVDGKLLDMTNVNDKRIYNMSVSIYNVDTTSTPSGGAPDLDRIVNMTGSKLN